MGAVARLRRTPQMTRTYGRGIQGLRTRLAQWHVAQQHWHRHAVGLGHGQGYGDYAHGTDLHGALGGAGDANSYGAPLLSKSPGR